MTMSYSVRNRLIISIVVLVVAPLFLQSIILPWLNYNFHKKQILDFQQELAIQASRNIFNYLQEQEYKIHALIRTNYLPDMPHAAQKILFSKLLILSETASYSNVFKEIAYVDVNGQEVVRVARNRYLDNDDLQDLSSSEEFLIPTQKDEPYYSSIFFNPRTGEPLMKISVPVKDLRFAKNKGVVVAVVSLKFLWNVVADIRVGETGTASILDQNGRVIAHPISSVVLKNSYYNIPNKPGIMKGVDGTWSVLAAERIAAGDQSLFFVTELPVFEAFNHVKQALLVNVVFLIISLAGTFILAMVLVRWLVRPVESLTRTAKEIEKGNYDKKAHIAARNEFGYLAQAFNDMTTKLLSTIKDLESEKDFVKTIIESLTHPFYVINVKDYTVEFANSAACAAPLGVGIKCYELTHDVDQPCSGGGCPCPIDEIKRVRKPVVMKHVHEMGEKGKREFEVYAYPIFDHKGELVQVIEYNIDITERNFLEEQLRQAQKLEAIGSLAGGVAHDFNNLLSVIIGYSEMLIMRFPKGDPARRDVDAIMSAGEKAASLTRQLLAFSRKQLLEVKVLNFNEVIERLVTMLTRIIGENIHLTLKKEESLWSIQADPVQMDQVMINLVVNAKDAISTNEGGVINIETSNIMLGEKYVKGNEGVKPGPYVLVTITDNGKGMSKKVIGKIFEPFYTTKGHKGTGLGLSTVYGIVKQHHGHINVYSEPDAGTTFKVYLPVTDAEAIKIASSEIQVDLKGSETILLVDDEASIVDMVSDTLKPLGYTVLKASSGEEALERYFEKNIKIDLLLTDVIMKGMNGRHLADALLAKQPLLKIIFMSGYSENFITNRGILEDGFFFIQKPVRPSNFVKKLREVLDDIVLV